MLLRRVAILGVGLIGGSLAGALKRSRFCESVHGFGRHRAQLQKAVDLGVIDGFSLDPVQAVQGADLVVVATPISATEELCRRAAAGLKEGAVITDVGSAKGRVVAAARAALSPEQFGRFVPGHPIAGTEKSGVENAFSHLFDDRLVILTPVDETAIRALQLVQNMWESCGARVVRLDVGHHDRVLAATSHLPHMLAYALVDCLARMQERQEIFEFAAGGFADFTRIASSSPEMWHDICFANREALLEMLNRFDGHLDEIRRAIESGDSRAILDIFSRAKQARDEFGRNHPPRQTAGARE